MSWPEVYRGHKQASLFLSQSCSDEVMAAGCVIVLTNCPAASPRAPHTAVIVLPENPGVV